MPVVTSIIPQKSKNKVCVYFDDKSKINVSIEVFAKISLKVGQDLSEPAIKEICKLADFQQILDKLTIFATIRPRSVKEILLWFKRKKIPLKMHDELFNQLKRLQLVNDFEFADWWIDQRNCFNPKPIKILKLELMQKGVSNSVIERVLSKTQVDDKENAINVLKKKMRKFNRYSGLEKTKRMVNYLLSKGYLLEDAKQAVNLINNQNQVEC